MTEAQRRDQSEQPQREDYLKETWGKVRTSRCKTVCCISITNIVAITYIILAGWMAILAYRSPDPKSCYFVLGLNKVHSEYDTIKKIASEEEITIRRGYPIDMAHVFRTYFTWGFWNIAAEAIIICFCSIVYCWKPVMACYQFVSFSGFVMVSSLFHFFLGLSWRFSSAGKVVSGDFLGKRPEDTSESAWATQLREKGYQIHGGTFMKYFLIIEIALYSIFTVFVVYGCFWLYFFKRTKEM